MVKEGSKKGEMKFKEYPPMIQKSCYKLNREKIIEARPQIMCKAMKDGQYPFCISYMLNKGNCEFGTKCHFIDGHNNKFKYAVESQERKLRTSGKDAKKKKDKNQNTPRKVTDEQQDEMIAITDEWRQLN